MDVAPHGFPDPGRREALGTDGTTSAGSDGAQGIGIREQGTVATSDDCGIVNRAPSPATGADAAVWISSLDPSGGGVDLLGGETVVRCAPLRAERATSAWAVSGGRRGRAGPHERPIDGHIIWRMRVVGAPAWRICLRDVASR